MAVDVTTVLSGEDFEPVEKQLCLGEVASIFFGSLAGLLLLSGLGFWTVSPPGEQDLCRIETLGLQNKTEDTQVFELAACHALYTGAFNILNFISVPFILCGLLAVGSAVFVARGVFARNEEDTPRFFKFAAVVDFAGLLAVWVPSLIFPALAATVDAGMAPIHAYWITITVGHYGMRALNTSDSGDEHMQKVTEIEEVLYQGYCAASRLSICLTVGSISMILLFWLYLFDMGRNISAVTCWKPNYNQTEQGLQILRIRRMLRKRYRNYMRVKNNTGET